MIIVGRIKMRKRITICLDLDCSIFII